MADLDELLCELPRGRRGVLRVRRLTERGEESVELRHFYPDGDELKPSHGLRLKPSEVMAVAAALMTLARVMTSVERTAALARAADRPRRQAQPPQQRPLPGSFRQPQDDNAGAVPDGERRLAEEIF